MYILNDLFMLSFVGLPTVRKRKKKQNAKNINNGKNVGLLDLYKSRVK